MARWLLALLGVVAVLVVSACGGDDEAEASGAGAAEEELTGLPGGFANEAELAWMRDVEQWTDALFGATDELTEIESDRQRFAAVVRGERGAVREYERALQPLVECSETFAARVGAAPSERLRESEDAFRDACRQYGDASELLLRSLKERDERLGERSSAAFEDGRERMDVATGMLPPGEKQELPERGGRTTTSRIEPEFSRVATQLAGKDVEARCWSRDDWRRLLDEQTVLAGPAPEDTVTLGFANAGGARVHLSPETCAALVRLRYERARPRGETATLRLATAAGTLAHEAVHVSGVADEPTAECHGVQLLERAALALRVQPAYAARLETTYWDNREDVPTLYRSKQCRDGGKLDLRPQDRDFP